MTQPHLRLASYNLQKCVGLDMRRRPDRALGVIEKLNADIVVLQEADKRLAPRPAALPRAMAEEAGWQIVRFEGNALSLGFHGNAMLFAPHIKLITSAKLDLPGLEPRGAIRAEFDTPIGPLRIIGTHLGLLRRYRLFQLQAIMKHLHSQPTMATALAGDFNEWGSPRALDAATHGLDIIDMPASFPAPRPVASLDRFALSAELRALKTGRHTAQPAHIASDHLPVWADITRH
jgi:endonuclease/exonuclease/phosphatase family metal-dependent hydrolase